MPSPLALALTQQQQAAPPPQVGLNPTDVGQIYKNAQDAAMAAWKARLDQQAAMWGNLATLGRAGITAFGGPLAGKLFDVAARRAAPPAQAGDWPDWTPPAV